MCGSVWTGSATSERDKKDVGRPRCNPGAVPESVLATVGRRLCRRGGTARQMPRCVPAGGPPSPPPPPVDPRSPGLSVTHAGRELRGQSRPPNCALSRTRGRRGGGRAVGGRGSGTAGSPIYPDIRFGEGGRTFGDVSGGRGKFAKEKWTGTLLELRYFPLPAQLSARNYEK